jgi:hypothetical protein
MATKRILRSIFGGLCFALYLMLANCQAAGTVAPANSLTVSFVQGNVTVQQSGKGELIALKIGYTLSSGDRLQAQEKSFVEFRDARSYVALGPQASAVIQAFSSDQALTQTKILLEKGSLYAVAEKPLTPGQVEVLTRGGSASIHGSGMIVSLSSSGLTSVGCTDGTASVNAGGTTVSLAANQSTAFMSSGIPNQPQSLDQKLFGDDPAMMEVINERYYHFAIVEATNYPTQPAATSKPSATNQPTHAPTITMMALGPTSTAQSTRSANPVRRATATYDPSLKGLTKEEEVNQGQHTFGVACQSWGNCVCDSALAVPSVNMTITFDHSGVNLAAKEGQLAYPRAAANLFRIEQTNLIAEITFLPNGWELFVMKGGNACSLQTYTRQ